MYGLSKLLAKHFGVLTNPGFGTIQPALKRLEKKNCVKTDKFYTDGGKPYYYYSVTENGEALLKSQLLNVPTSNPVQLIPNIRVRLICSEVLDNSQKKELCRLIKTELHKVQNSTEVILKDNLYDSNFPGRMVMDNVLCEYKNLLTLTEGIEKCLQ